MKISSKLTSEQIEKDFQKCDHNKLNKLKSLVFIPNSNLLFTYQDDFLNIFYLNETKLKILTRKRINNDLSVVQLGYLKFSKQVILLPQNLIINLSINCINNCKFLSKYDHKLYSQANILLSRDENFLFASKFHSICIFQQVNSSWNCIEELDDGSIIHYVKQIKINKLEDKLICYLYCGGFMGDDIIVYKKNSIKKKQPLWIKQQHIVIENDGNKIGQLLDYIDDQFFYLNFNQQLEVYSYNQKQNKFEKIRLYQENYFQKSLLKNSIILHHYNKTFLIKQNEVNSVKFQKDGIFVLYKLIMIDQEEPFVEHAQNSVISDDCQYLVLWNKQFAFISRLTNTNFNQIFSEN